MDENTAHYSDEHRGESSLCGLKVDLKSMWMALAALSLTAGTGTVKISFRNVWLRNE